jgi:hypothetical protein
MLTTGNEIIIYNIQSRGGRTIAPANPVAGLAFSPDEKMLLTGDTQGNLQVWNLATSKLMDTPVKYEQSITALVAAQDQLILGMGDEVRVLDINTFEELQQPRSNAVVELLAIQPEGTLLAATNSQGQVQIWQSENGRFGPPRALTSGNGASLAFSTTGHLLAIGGVDSLVLLDPSTLEEHARLPMPGTVTAVSFSPDGATFTTSSLRVLQSWDLTKIQPVPKDAIIETACLRLFENLSYNQWNLLFRNEEYKPLCTNLPVPDS